MGLGFEKEVRADGTTENKHYVSAGGTVFALFTSRSGPLNGLPASSTRYFHHDQLGSIAAITNEAGAVVERLAYDRGVEMVPHEKLTQNTGIKVFFCDPYSPWQRACNENMNGLVHQYLPKAQTYRRSAIMSFFVLSNS